METDHDKRLRRSTSIRIVHKERKRLGYCITVKDRRINHVVVMKKEKRAHQTRGGRTRETPPFRHARFTDRKTRVNDPKDSLKQIGPVVGTIAYHSVSCTCPDWNFRGVYHRSDRSTTLTDFDKTGRRKIGVLRAADGCKHMLAANDKCAND